jgi:hypothetical protein
VVASNDQLYPGTVPAGIPSRGVDYGLDAVTATRSGLLSSIRFSPEILYRGDPPFTDGDLLRNGDGISDYGRNLTAPFEPLVDFLGTDAYYRRISDEQAGMDNFLSLVFRTFGISIGGSSR